MVSRKLTPASFLTKNLYQFNILYNRRPHVIMSGTSTQNLDCNISLVVELFSPKAEQIHWRWIYSEKLQLMQLHFSIRKPNNRQLLWKSSTKTFQLVQLLLVGTGCNCRYNVSHRMSQTLVNVRIELWIWDACWKNLETDWTAPSCTQAQFSTLVKHTGNIEKSIS